MSEIETIAGENNSLSELIFPQQLTPEGRSLAVMLLYRGFVLGWGGSNVMREGCSIIRGSDVDLRFLAFGLWQMGISLFGPHLWVRFLNGELCSSLKNTDFYRELVDMFVNHRLIGLKKKYYEEP